MLLRSWQVSAMSLPNRTEPTRTEPNASAAAIHPTTPQIMQL